MRILHTADWHLGKRLDNFSRFEEQVQVLDEIVKITEEHHIDLVLIAGDLFDNFNPATEAIELFYRTLKRLSNGGKRPVIAISGNHDSPTLIDAPDPLARECGIVLIGHPQAIVVPMDLEDFKISKSTEGFLEIEMRKYNYPVRVLHTAYANELRLKQYFGEDKSIALNHALAESWSKIADTYCDHNGVNILTAHLYMNKQGQPLIDEPDGERPIKIGNADLIFSNAIPPQIQYTALGHIHRYQNIGNEERPVVYSSSPLSYSFNEAGQTKYVIIVDIEPNKRVETLPVALTQGRPLVRKVFKDIPNAIQWLTENPNVLVELTLESDTFLKSEDRKAIYQAHDGIIHLIPKVKNDGIQDTSTTAIDLDQNITDLFQQYFKSKNSNQSPNEELMQLFNKILND